MLASESIANAIDRLEYLNAISASDRHVAEQAIRVKRRWTAIRVRTHRLLVRVDNETQAVVVRASRVLATRDRLSSNRENLRSERRTKQRTLANVRESRAAWLADIAALQAGSANIAARLRSGGSHSGATPSAAGLIWPVQGVLTSPFGMSWGRMHEGIDIGAAQGTYDGQLPERTYLLKIEGRSAQPATHPSVCMIHHVLFPFLVCFRYSTNGVRRLL